MSNPIEEEENRNPPPTLTAETAKNMSEEDRPIKLLKPMVGTSMSRFLNQYNPYFDKPFEKPTLNSGIMLNAELTQLLEEERQSKRMSDNHKKKDWMKSYMDECVKFQSITKGKK